MKEKVHEKQLARKYSLDLPRYSSIEFPLNVVNDHKALELVGGKQKIKESLVEKNVQLELRLRPDDPYQHAIHSDVSTAENFLVKIRLPKGELAKHNGNIPEAIKNNKDHCRFEPIAIINKNFRFREIADFQMNTYDNQMAQDVTQTFFGNDYDKIKEFKELLTKREQFDITKPLDLPPFSTFSKVKMPFSYNFTNNKGTAVKGEDGTVRYINKTQPFKVNTSFVPWDAPAPEHPTDELIQFLKEAQESVETQLSKENLPLNIVKNSSNYQLVECVKLLQKLFDEKPIWLRRHLYSITPSNWRNIFRYALAYVAYTSRTGAWKQSYIRFGVDPKSSPEYAKYQTERFRVHTSNKQSEEDDENEDPAGPDDTPVDSSIDKDSIKDLPADFKFNGSNVPKISSFQLNDISDPQLQELFVAENMVDEISERDGWFKPVVLEQFRAIMKYKLTCLVLKEPISSQKVEQVRERAVNRHNSKLQQNGRPHKAHSGSPGDEDDEDEDEDDEEDDEEEEEEEDIEPKSKSDFLSDGDLLSRFKALDPQTLDELKGLIMQEDLMDIGSK